jgi:hypothetical protein
MKITTSLLRGFRALNKRNNFFFAQEEKKDGNKLVGYIKSAWQQTFPDE